ncbi:BgTH12-05775 [Blumeria graminis f. sp. triticale]|uniref:6,7-dimethyl-8-ribityllumazine synthase n=3 Tax=Blumeria graminis TaxID=34373 RepID=A0A381L4H2_BLUGR|nr:Lumazine synthase 67-dimethyl-8-ribityllumazine synthase [Blumeria graminis f. sp. tritici 96224]CAD6504038.1 BgTH12-05775 [Blumeria graminis f. sp. triticale]VDB90772.1 Bgt-905 [Blumeria graminis f. sp. tritici]
MTSVKGPGKRLDLNGSELRIGVVHARWNTAIIDPLLHGVLSSLDDAGVARHNIIVKSVPGSWELPIACSLVERQARENFTELDALIAIGVLIKGETMHFEYIAEAVSSGLMRVQLDSKVPVIFGLLTVLNEEQAKERAGITQGSHNHGEDWGKAAVEMGRIKSKN